MTQLPLYARATILLAGVVLLVHSLVVAIFYVISSQVVELVSELPSIIRKLEAGLYKGYKSFRS